MKKLRDLLTELRKDYKNRTVYLYGRDEGTYTDGTYDKFSLTNTLLKWETDPAYKDTLVEDWEIFDNAPEIAIYTNIEDD